MTRIMNKGKVTHGKMESHEHDHEHSLESRICGMERVIVLQIELACNRILLALRKDVVQQMADFKQEMEALKAQVKANTDVEASALALIQGIAARLAAAAGDPAEVKALADELKASADPLAAAVAENTAAPEPTPTP